MVYNHSAINNLGQFMKGENEMLYAVIFILGNVTGVILMSILAITRGD